LAEFCLVISLCEACRQ